MEMLKVAAMAPERGVRATHGTPVIIATDGREQSDAALAVGRLFAGSPDALRLVTVLKPMPVYSEAQLVAYGDVDAARRDDAMRQVLEQSGRAWAVEREAEVLDGDPATVVAGIAHSSGAIMIVCGLGRHRVADRVFGDETALRLVRLADVPVFAAASGMRRAPRRIVVATDFSETSLRAARLVLDTAGRNATIYLAHVAPRDRAPRERNGVARTYMEDAGAALQRTREQLHVPEDMLVQNVLLQGDPATELLAFAASANADLIATGSHGHGFVARMLIGSVATRIVRCSTCSVLTVPYAAAMA
jgi:nucleotide-binding universal stress UspA family protein